MRNSIIYILLIITSLNLITGCSTTKRLGEDEVLYTGVKKIKIETLDSTKLASGVADQIKDALNVTPNNSLYSPYIRYPFPLGLWVYNSWEITPKTGKFKKWIYDMLASEPVLISSVRPELRMEMLKDILDNNGYFGSTPSYKLLFDKNNNKKARISYSIIAPAPYTLSDIEYIKGDDILTQKIDSIAAKSSYLKSGNRYCTDSLNMVRSNISDVLRIKGYFYFRPEYIEYLADSTLNHGKIALKLVYAKNIPAASLVKYKTGTIITTINRNLGGGTPDTITTNNGIVIQMKPSNLRKGLIPSCVTFKPGKVFSLRDMNRTQSYLSRLGIFRNVNIDVTPLDSIKPGTDSLNVNINCTFDAPIETTLQFGGSYKSNSYLGPGAKLGIAHNNLFGGGEQLSVNLTAAYDWQIGKTAGNGGDINYYEIGLGTTLSFPRLLAPKFISRSKRNINWTRISLNADLYNNPSSIKYFQLKSAFTYEWHNRRNSMHELSLLKLTYSKRLREADSITNMETAGFIRPTEFIPQISYSYVFDYSFGKRRENNIVWRSTISEAGNIMSGLWSLTGAKSGVGEKELFGVPFSQYIKIQTQLVYSYKFPNNQYLVWRGHVGAGFVYGNSAQLPYGEDFYAGGPNSIRAFAVRSLGPGSFKDISGWDSQLMHGGSFITLMNLEYRFPIFGLFHGAAFVDAGNVWLLKDPLNIYEGGLLNGKTFFKDIALGTGVGLRLDLSMLVVRADLGIGIHAPYDTGKAGYYNMTSFKNSLTLNFAIGYPF